MKPENKNILITGGAGFVGCHLCKLLIAEGHHVSVIDLITPKDAIPGVTYSLGDVRDPHLLEDILADIDIVFHLAAIVSIPLCQKNPTESYASNLMATINLLEAIKNKKEKNNNTIRLCFTSSAAVYGNNGTDGHALSESDVSENFQSFYAAQKHASEQAIKLYQKHYGISAIIFRLFNVFGPGQDPLSPYSGVITLFSKFAHEKLPIPLNGGGLQTRDFISVYDVVKAFMLTLKLPLTQWNAEPINLGSGKSITIRQLAEDISIASHLPVNLVEAPFREGDVLHSRANISRAIEILNFHPQEDFMKILTEVMEHK